MVTARDAALRTLYKIFYEDAYSNLALKEMLASCRAMERNEKKLLTNIVYGVVSHNYTLEYVISKYSKVKIKKLAKYVKLILEMGIYQLMYADKIPQSAAVNESVRLARKYCRKGSDSFVNGVLRSFCRDGMKVDLPDDKYEYLAVKYSFGADMTKYFVDDFGFEKAEMLMSALNEAPPLLLRANTIKNSPEELCDKLKKQAINANVTSFGQVKTEGFDISANTLFKNGCFTVQDAGAFCATLQLNPQKGETVIDMCAAPGGKTTHIAELMENDGTVLAFDVHEHKVKLIQNAAKRLGLTCIQAFEGDGTVHNPNLEESADKVLCDVPCSGWGIIRRKPDIKLKKIQFENLIPIQKEILKNASTYVKSGGGMVYSTCTVNKRENEDVVNEFLADNPNFEKTYEKTFYPFEDGSDGFYICGMMKK